MQHDHQKQQESAGSKGRQTSLTAVPKIADCLPYHTAPGDAAEQSYKHIRDTKTYAFHSGITVRVGLIIHDTCCH